MNAELIASILNIGAMVAKAVTDAITACDVSAVQELTKHLPLSAQIEARSAALRVEALRKARESLSTMNTPPDGIPTSPKPPER